MVPDRRTVLCLLRPMLRVLHRTPRSRCHWRWSTERSRCVWSQVQASAGVQGRDAALQQPSLPQLRPAGDANLEHAGSQMPVTPGIPRWPPAFRPVHTRWHYRVGSAGNAAVSVHSPATLAIVATRRSAASAFRVLLQLVATLLAQSSVVSAAYTRLRP